MWLQKPRLLHCEYGELDNAKRDVVIINDDGNRGVIYVSSANLATDTTDRQRIKQVFGYAWGPGSSWNVFFQRDALAVYRPKGTTVKVIGTVAIGGDSCDVIEIRGKTGYVTHRLYIGPDATLRGQYLRWKQGDQEFTTEARLTNVHLNAPIPKRVFEYKPPKGAKQN